MCKNTTENNNFCKSPDEIDHWGKSNNFYLIRQDTMVDKSIYYDDAKDFKDEETKTYWPLRRHMKSEIFQALHSDHTSEIVELIEVSLGLNQLTFDDNWFQFGFSERTKYFVDFLQIR